MAIYSTLGKCNLIKTVCSVLELPITFTLASITLIIKLPEVILAKRLLHETFCAPYSMLLKRTFWKVSCML